MQDSPHSARVRFFNAMAVLALVVCVIAIFMFYVLGPINFGGQAAAPTTSTRIEPRRTSPTRPEVVRKPMRVSPFTDLTDTNPRLREQVLSSRLVPHMWLTDPDTTPEMRAEAAEQIRKACTDDDPDVRLAAADFVSSVKFFPEVKPSDAVPVWEAFLTDKDDERRVKAAVALWEKHAHAEAGKVLVRVVKNRAAESIHRTHAAAAVTHDPPPTRPPGMTEALDAVLVNRTENKSVRFAAFDQFKRAQGKGTPLPAGFRKTLFTLAEQGDPDLGYAAVKELTTDLRRQDKLPDDLRPTLLKLVETKTTASELRAAAYDALLAAKPDADTRKVAEELLDDADTPADMRAKAFELLVAGAKVGEVPDDLRPTLLKLVETKTTAADVRAKAFELLVAGAKVGEVPDAVRPLVVKLAADADTPTDLRIRAFRLLAPASDTFAKTYPELAAVLEKAVTDGKAKMEFRAFAARYYKPDTAEKFATAVELGTTSAITSFNTAFNTALGIALAEQFPDGKSIPKEWVTAKLAERIAKNRFVYAPDRLDPLFADALFAFGKEIVPALVEGLNESTIRRRNVAVLERFGADAKPAAPRVFDLLTSQYVSEDDKVMLLRVIAAFGPDEIVNRLKGKGGTVEERALLLKQLKQDAKARLALFTELLAHDQQDVRMWAASEVGKIGPDAKTAIPKLVEQLKADVAATKKSGTQPGHGPFVEAIAAIGPDCLPAVTELTADAEPMVRVAAAEVFGYLGTEVRSKATPLLRKMVEEDKDETVKQSALHALGQVNPKEAEKLGWTPPQARRADPEQVPVYVDRPVPVYRDPLPAYTSPKPTMPAYKPYTPPYRPYIPVYRPLYLPRR